MEKNQHQETYEGKITHLCHITDLEDYDAEKFVDIVMDYLREFVINDDDWIDYNMNDFGKCLMDVAVDYNKRQGVEYEVKVVKDEYDDKVQPLIDKLNS